MKQETMQEVKEIDLAKYDFKDSDHLVTKLPKGLSRELVEEISRIKKEPEWMKELRLRAYDQFITKPLPTWGPDLSELKFEDMTYFIRPDAKNVRNWDEVPKEIKDTFDKLGIPEAEQKYLAGSVAQYESESVYHNIKKQWEDKGVIFCDMDTAVQKYPELVRKYFMRAVPITDNKFAALHAAVWSGGSFTYVPAGVKIDQPLQTYFRMNAANEGQFEHTLVIADEGSKVHYMEGCFVKGTPIVFDNGIKNIEDIKEGDFVLTHKNRYKMVYDTMKRKYSGKMYHINYYGDTSQKISATEEHPFLVSKKEKEEYSNKKWKTEWVTASQLRKGDYLAIPIDRKVEPNDERTFNVKFGKSKNIQLKIKIDKDFFRLIGYYLSEGSTGKEHYLMFTFNKNEKSNIEDVKNLLIKYFGKEPIVMKEYKNGISIVLCSTVAARFFNDNFNHSAKTKQLPRWALNETIEKQVELIKGYWRGDGSFMYKTYPGATKRMFRINTISEKLAKQIRDVLLRLNIFSSINLAKRSLKYKNKNDMFTIYIGGKFIQSFAEIVEVYEAITIDNKYQMLTNLSNERIVSYATIIGDYAFVPIKNITEEIVEDLDVYNFSVEEDESYTAGHVTVHNCTAPKYSSHSLHSAVVEIYVKKNAEARYTTVQNWSKNVFNLNTKRAIVEENGKMEWVGGSLGCITGDTVVYSNPHGPIRMSEIREGDKVYSLDLNDLKLKKAIVKAKIFSGIKDVYKLTTERGREIKATDNHPFLVLRNSKMLSWMPLAGIRQGDFISIVNSLPDEGRPYKLPEIAIRGKNVVEYPKETNEDLMWLFGVYLGDGYISKEAKNKHSKEKIPRRTYFAVPETDKIREKLKQKLNDIFKAKITKKGICITINSVMLCELIIKLGFSGLAHTKRIPSWIYSLPISQKLAFIEGYLDSDGYVRKKFGIRKNKQYAATFTSCNKELLGDLKTLMISCGISPGNLLQHKRKRPSPTSKGNRDYINYAINIPGEDTEKIRLHKSETSNNVTFDRVKSIHFIAKEPTYDIQVDGSPNFIANGILVHNSYITMLYPCSVLKGDNATASHLNIAFGAGNTWKDGGAKVIHVGKNTSSKIIAKSISMGGGVGVYRGLVRINKGAKYAKSHVQCDALILDEKSRSDTYPHNEIYEETATLSHEASVGKISDDQVFYLMSRGLSETEARGMIVLGFLDDVLREIPMEFSVEMNRLVHMEMSKLGAIG